MHASRPKVAANHTLASVLFRPVVPNNGTLANLLGPAVVAGTGQTQWSAGGGQPYVRKTHQRSTTRPSTAANRTRPGLRLS
jgi:hypothetical protein